MIGRMPGRRFTMLAALSLLVLAFHLALWGYTTCGVCGVRYGTPVRKDSGEFFRRVIGTSAQHGCVSIDYTFVHSPFGVGTPANQGRLIQPFNKRWAPTPDSILLALFRFGLPTWSDHVSGSGTWRDVSVLVPFWVLTFPWALLPAIWFIRYRRHRAARPGGFDLAPPCPPAGAGPVDFA
jgi:hypothetical protein